MKLSNKSKDELREKIAEQLKEVPKGQRVQLDKDLLEDLLFEIITLNKEKGITIKLPIWSGDFLKKIDLSEIDFTDVSWNSLILEDVILPELEIYGIKIDDFAISTIERVIQKYSRGNNLESFGNYDIKYDGTNAKIDFSKSFEAIHGKDLSICSCNFDGLDFSKQDLTSITSIFIYSSNLGGTKLPVGNIPLEAWRSEFNGIDLSAQKIDAFQSVQGEYSDLSACNLTNCGVQITLNTEKFSDGKHESELKQALNTNWIGCYVNGKKVLSPEEKLANATKKREEYQKMKETIFNSVLGSIEEQVGHAKKYSL